MDDRQELIERWKIAYAEHRAEVLLNWDRAKTFMVLNPVLTAGAASFAKTAWLGRLTLVIAALTALAGALVLYRGHTRYRAARAAFQGLEDKLGFDDLQTTGGQRAARGAPKLERFTVLNVLVTLFVLNALLDLLLAATFGS